MKIYRIDEIMDKFGEDYNWLVEGLIEDDVNEDEMDKLINKKFPEKFILLTDLIKYMRKIEDTDCPCSCDYGQEKDKRNNALCDFHKLVNKLERMDKLVR